MRTGIVFAVALLSIRAVAADGDPVQVARSLYNEGLAEFDLGRFREALDRFERAYRVRSAPALLFNIAQCHRKLGELEEAATTYRSFLARDPNHPEAQRARELLHQIEETIEKNRQTVKAPPNTLPAPPSHLDATRASGEKRVPQAAVAPGAATPSAAAVRRPRVLTWIAAGASGLALAGGVVSAMQMRSTESTYLGSVHSRRKPICCAISTHPSRSARTSCSSSRVSPRS
jgi:tetratricopeptide (TPR) repeat protein